MRPQSQSQNIYHKQTQEKNMGLLSSVVGNVMKNLTGAHRPGGGDGRNIGQRFLGLNGKKAAPQAKASSKRKTPAVGKRLVSRAKGKAGVGGGTAQPKSSQKQNSAAAKVRESKNSVKRNSRSK